MSPLEDLQEEDDEEMEKGDEEMEEGYNDVHQSMVAFFYMLTLHGH